MSLFCRGLMIAAASLVLAAGCSPLAVINATVDEDAYVFESGLAYGDHERQRLDVYAPRAADRAPVVIFFYGGSWQRGERRDYRFVGDALAGRSMVVVVPDYRVYPEVRYPAFIDDGALALDWVRENIGDFGGDPSTILLAGHSAGAYIAAMLGLERNADVQGIIGLAGPYDFLPLTSDNLREIFSTADDLSATQPISHVDGDEAPMLLLIGDDDRVVDPGNSLRLADEVRRAGGTAEVVTFEGIGHAMLVGSLARALRWRADTLETIAGFVEQTNTMRDEGIESVARIVRE
jgi:acetyl esterase/lipase